MEEQGMTIEELVDSMVAQLKTDGQMPASAEVVDIEVIGDTTACHIRVTMSEGEPLIIDAQSPSSQGTFTKQ